ncbi:MAG: AAA-like domain protein [Schlesneria sp.]|nr:AAA-like domain protein [Schlesneria sp.]
MSTESMKTMIESAIARWFFPMISVRPGVPKPFDPLDMTLLNWNDMDRFTKRHLLNGGVCVTGRAGSGKTSSSGRLIGNAIIGHDLSGGLILGAKPEDLGNWKSMFASAGRSHDLLVFAPDSPLRFNFLGYVLESGGHTRDVTRCITMIAETLRSSDTSGGENADFWEREQERMIYNAVEIIKQAKGTVSAPDIQRFITSAPQCPAEIMTEAWRAEFCNQCMATAFNVEKSAVEAHDFQLASDYWLSEFPIMSEKTRSSILTGVMGLLHVFNVGVVRELVSTTTNVTPDDMLSGKWVFVDMAPAEWGDMGTLVAAGWKYLTQRRVLRRHAQPDDFINVIWADEYHQFVNSFDSYYIAQCRSHLGCMVVLSQSLSSYYAALKGDAGKNLADALLPNFGTKIFHALGDLKSAEWASGLIGKNLQTFFGVTTGPVENIWEEMNGRGKVTMSTTEHYESELQPAVLLNGLRTGGHVNGLICDGIVIRSGEPFSNGANWLEVTFSQKDPVG